MRALVILIAFIAVLAPLSARADCTMGSYLSTDGRATWVEGGVAYDPSGQSLKVCDGSNWNDAGGSVSALDDIGDVNAASPVDQATLVWDAGSSEWIAGSAQSGCALATDSIVPVMTSSPQSGYTATASTVYSGTFSADNGFDGAAGSGAGNAWVTSNGTTTGWLRIQLPTAQIVEGYTVMAWSGDATAAPATWTFQGSNDGSSWTTLDTQTSLTFSSSEEKSFSVTNSTAYSYYRVNITANGGYGSYTVIGDMKLQIEQCSGADDLGDHTATQALAMAGYNINNAGAVSATTFYSNDSNAYFYNNFTTPVLVFDSTDYLRYNRSSNTYNFLIGGTSYLSLTTTGISTTNAYFSGNVGIGTTSPQSNLHVAKSSGFGFGNIKVGDDVASASGSLNGLGLLGYSDGSNYIDSKVQTGGYTYFRTGANTETGYARTWMAVQGSTGNVGIGTTGPVNKLTIEGNGVTVNPYYGAYLANSYYDGAWKYVGNGVAWGIGNNFGGTTDGTTIAVATSNASGANAALTWLPVFNIDTTGNVGIGTTGPGSKLDVNGAIRSATGLFANGAAGSDNRYLWYTTSGSSRFSVGLINTAESGSSVGSDYVINRYNDSGTWQDSPFFIKRSSGNVGIGTTSPGQRLTVEGGSIQIDNNKYIFGKNAAGTSKLMLNPRSDDYTEMRSIGNGIYLANSSGVAKLTVLEGGNVGIGNSSPNEGKVEVKGGSVCVDTNSDNTASSCIANESDARLKQNVKPLADSLETVLKLQGVTFDWRVSDTEVLKHYPLIARFANQPHAMGLIAQDVQEILPYVIEQETVGDDNVQYLQLDYAKLVPLTIEAIKELKASNDNQVEEIKELRREVERLKAILPQ